MNEDVKIAFGYYINVCRAMETLESAGLHLESSSDEGNVGYFLYNAKELAFDNIALKFRLPLDANLTNFRILLEDIMGFENVLEEVFGCTKQDFIACLDQACFAFSKMWYGGKWAPNSRCALDQLMVFPFVISVCNASGVSAKVCNKTLEIDSLIQKSTYDFAKILQKPFKEFSKEINKKCAATLDGYLLNMFAEYTEALELYGQDEEKLEEENIEDEEEI